MKQQTVGVFTVAPATRRRTLAIEKLKAERVQQELKSMAGWRLVPGSRLAIDRALEFPDVHAASKYARFVNDFAALHGQPARVVLSGTRVRVVLRGRRVAGSRTELTEAVLDFAKKLG